MKVLLNKYILKKTKNFLFQAEHRLKAFHGARVCFLGFPEDERKHMADILAENGGISTDIADPACTHVVSIIQINFMCIMLHVYPFLLTYFLHKCFIYTATSVKLIFLTQN